MLREATLCLLMRGNPPEQVLLGYKKEGFGAGKITGFGGKVEPSETPGAAAIRELQEEVGITVAIADLQAVGQLHFIFPSRPAWSQLVHVYLAKRWGGVPVEGREMRPDWYAIDQVPYAQMWEDSAYWLPRVMTGERIRGRFVFGADSETVVDGAIDTWEGPSGEGLRSRQEHP
jgi:8-oxo-dGTP diphosphatase